MRIKLLVSLVITPAALAIACCLVPSPPSTNQAFTAPTVEPSPASPTPTMPMFTPLPWSAPVTTPAVSTGTIYLSAQDGFLLIPTGCSSNDEPCFTDPTSLPILPSLPHGSPANMAVSPDGRLIAFSMTDGTPDLTLSSVFSIRSDGTGFTQLAEPQSGFPDFSPDGSTIAYTTGDSRLCLLQLGGTVRCNTPNEGYAVAPRWSPDGQFIAYCVQTGILCTTVVAAADGSSSIPILPYTSPYVEWSPDSTHLALAQCYSSGCHLFVADTAACREHRLQCLTSLAEMGDAYRPAWSPDGRHLAFLSGDPKSNSIVLLDAGCFLEPTSCPGSALHLTPANGIIASLAWSPDSRQLAYVADTPTGAFIRVVQIDGSGTTEVSLTGELERGSLTELLWR